MLDYTDSFTCQKRANASYFYRIKDDPINDDLRSLMQAIHVALFYDAFPDDWVYTETYYAFERLAECKTGEEYEIAKFQVEGDAYTYELLQWVQSGYAQQYVEDILEEMRLDGGFPESLDDIVRRAQIRAKERIYEYVWEFLTLDDCKKEGCDGEGDGKQAKAD